ncbi:hypothetical protein Tco_0457545, partial [Tanacetum coccineum]
MLSCSNGFGDLNQIIPPCGHGKGGLLGKPVESPFPSIWLDIIRDLDNLKDQDIDLLGLFEKKIVTP